MKIAVVGLWHLGTVTAAALAAEGHDVVALDSAEIVASLNAGGVPVDEPGLRDLIAEQCAAGRLRFADAPAAAAGAQLVWFTYDTPVDDDDNADVAFVVDAATAFLAAFPGEAVVAISSQLPVGSGAQIAARAGERFRFAAIPPKICGWVRRLHISASRIASSSAPRMRARARSSDVRSRSRRRSSGWGSRPPR